MSEIATLENLEPFLSHPPHLQPGHTNEARSSTLEEYFQEINYRSVF